MLPLIKNDKLCKRRVRSANVVNYNYKKYICLNPTKCMLEFNNNNIKRINSEFFNNKINNNNSNNHISSNNTKHEFIIQKIHLNINHEIKHMLINKVHPLELKNIVNNFSSITKISLCK